MHAFRPIQVGTMHLDHRLVVPPHMGGGTLLDSAALFERHCAYWLARVKGGVQWVGGEPATRSIRHPLFAEWMGEYVDRLHAVSAYATVQLEVPGGSTAAGGRGIELIRDCSESAVLAAQAGADAIELRSSDGRYLAGIVGAIRAMIDRPITIGVRLGLGGMVDDGRQLAECQALIAGLSTDAMIDYFALDVGGDLAAGSHVPAGMFDEAVRAELCGQAKQATHLPVVYVGRVLDVATAERVLIDGHADLVAITRAAIADPDIVARTRRGETELVRPCVGTDDCADRRVVDGVGLVCAANPHAGHEQIVRLPPVQRSRRVLVIGGGPAGTEFAALAKQRGHRVTLWERDSMLGGQLAVAAKARLNAPFAEWIRWQQTRLQRLAVTVELGHEATLDDIEIVDPDVVVVATGAVPRTIDVPGIDRPFVSQAIDVLNERVEVGHSVVVVADGDGAAPLAVADHLIGLGHRVTVIHRTAGPSADADRYTIGASLARLDIDGMRFEPMARLVAVEPGRVHLAHSFSGRRWTIDGVDSVVLACGAISNNALYLPLRKVRSNVHLLGDAYEPGRMASATGQAWELAQSV